LKHTLLLGLFSFYNTGGLIAMLDLLLFLLDLIVLLLLIEVVLYLFTFLEWLRSIGAKLVVLFAMWLEDSALFWMWLEDSFLTMSLLLKEPKYSEFDILRLFLIWRGDLLSEEDLERADLDLLECLGVLSWLEGFLNFDFEKY
jgi:hypothetical protein